MDGGADGCQQDDLTCDPLSPAAVDDQLRRRCAALLPVQFTQQLETSTHFDFSRDAVEPFIVTVADEVPSDFAIELDVPPLHREFRREEELWTLVDETSVRHRLAGVDFQLGIDRPGDP